MWGAGKVLIAVIGVIVTILITGQWNNSTKISLNSVRIAKHEVDMESSMHKLETFMTVMSINQKRHMEVDGVKYIEPSPSGTFKYKSSETD